MINIEGLSILFPVIFSKHPSNIQSLADKIIHIQGKNIEISSNINFK